MLDYGRAKSHYLNLLFKQGKERPDAKDIKKGSPAYDQIVYHQKNTTEQEFELLLAELADKSQVHYDAFLRYWLKHIGSIVPQGQALAAMKKHHSGPLNSVADLVIGSDRPVQAAPPPLLPLLEVEDYEWNQNIGAFIDNKGDIYPSKETVLDPEPIKVKIGHIKGKFIPHHRTYIEALEMNDKFEWEPTFVITYSKVPVDIDETTLTDWYWSQQTKPKKRGPK